MEVKVRDWRAEGKHLPKFMRDFHDQKDLFKTMYDCVDVEEHKYVSEITWVTGHCYIIDIFLWFMARFGYTLQKTHTKLPFEDIVSMVDECGVARSKGYSEMLLTALEEAD